MTREEIKVGDVVVCGMGDLIITRVDAADKCHVRVRSLKWYGREECRIATPAEVAVFEEWERRVK